MMASPIPPWAPITTAQALAGRVIADEPFMLFAEAQETGRKRGGRLCGGGMVGCSVAEPAPVSRPCALPQTGRDSASGVYSCSAVNLGVWWLSDRRIGFGRLSPSPLRRHRAC